MEERYEAFKENYLKIDSHNARSDKSFKMAVNRFSDMTEAEFVQERLTHGGAKPHSKQRPQRQGRKHLKSIIPLGPDG